MCRWRVDLIVSVRCRSRFDRMFLSCLGCALISACRTQQTRTMAHRVLMNIWHARRAAARSDHKEYLVPLAHVLLLPLVLLVELRQLGVVDLDLLLRQQLVLLLEQGAQQGKLGFQLP